MKQKHIDAYLKTQGFRRRLEEADDYAEKASLDQWGTRILWVALTCNVRVAYRFARRRSHFRASLAWDRVNRFLDHGWGSLEPEGIYHTWEDHPVWEEHPLEWFNHIVKDISNDQP